LDLGLGDAKLNNRASADHPWQFRKPDLAAVSGSPTATPQGVELAAGDAFRPNTSFHLARGTDDLVVFFDGAMTSGQFWLKLEVDGGNYYRVRFRNNGDVDFQHEENSAGLNSTTVGTWDNTQGRYRLQIEQSADINGNGDAGYAVSVDGTELGTVLTSAAFPTREVRFDNASDVTATVEAYSFR
jgi:hypothetical protein